MGVRFAPSPTGAFHLGNLRTAWIAGQWAERLGLPLVVRIEDIDRPRNVEGAAERQIEDMRALRISPSEILIQSHFHERHLESFERAVRDEMVYPCFCSRKEVVEGLASAPHGPMTVYTGRCRGLRADEWPAYDRPTLAWRFKLNPSDPTQDFVVARTAAPGALASWSPREGFAPAYQWACAVDDYDGRYTLLVRAFDLLDSAAQQRGIQSWLASNANAPVRHPAVFHTALIVNDDSSRLEKRTKGVTLAELIARGLTEKTIIEKFESTFHIDRYQFAPGAIFGEDRRQMTLSELGF